MRKIKKLVATLLAATMVLAMGVTAFAAENDSETLAAGTYTVKATLYKDADCTSTSMGNKGMVDSTLTVNDDGTATFVFKTIKFKYIGLSGNLKKMSLDGVEGAYTTTSDSNYEYHIFTFDRTLPLSSFTVGKVFTGAFEMNIANIRTQSGTGYLKITSITAQ